MSDILTKGVCRVCGCTEDDPCHNPNVGNCWWADETQTICSHCADKKIAEDPMTKHCINSNTEDDDVEFQMQQEFEELYDKILSGDLGWDASDLDRLLDLHLNLKMRL